MRVLTVALVTGAAEACAFYDQCRCTMANNEINNTITGLAKDYLEAHDHNIRSAWSTWEDGNNTAWIKLNQNGQDVAISNCKIREACTEVGATGEDSWCETKNQGLVG
ncbi:hypothetical protein LZ32DRAFT_599971 [Colletotrichum eremochloae]|nr:hypothetical protein LZ32DRAFT_599971 [Colletotrichum eremochloae]